MKILFISIPSIHAIRWIDNLKDTSYEIYWFDVLGRGGIETIDKVQQITGWKRRRIPYLKGEHWLRKKLPIIYTKIQPFLEITANQQLENIIQEIKPDLVHSFEMQSCSYPILKTMNKYPAIKWIYSCWGSDLFYFQNVKHHNLKIRKVLNRVNLLHTDCMRDFNLAKKLGFKGKHVGVIPGGSGFKLAELEKYKKPINDRTIILVKGYEHHFGRGLNIVKALNELKHEVLDYEIVVFGAHEILINHIKKHHLPFKVFDRNGLTHNELLELMGKSKIYIGNSISDGMPNTLLEGMVMNAFPIQSNPGNVTSEIIENKVNGLLINNPEDIDEIKSIIKLAITFDDVFYEKAALINTTIANKRLDFKVNKQKIINLYHNIELNITECE